MNTVIVPISHGEASADLIFQFGEGTEDPSVMLNNRNRMEQIKLGEIQRFPNQGRQ